MPTFEDWFEAIALPYFLKLEGKKVLIGDNLSSHLSVEVVRKCEFNQILLVFLPPNSTHILQPPDVSFFRPIKKAWRKILEDKKRSCRGKPCSLAKDSFPLLLKSLYKEVYTSAASNIKAGFEKCDLFSGAYLRGGAIGPCPPPFGQKSNIYSEQKSVFGCNVVVKRRGSARDTLGHGPWVYLGGNGHYNVSSVQPQKLQCPPPSNKKLMFNSFENMNCCVTVSHCLIVFIVFCYLILVLSNKY